MADKRRSFFKIPDRKRGEEIMKCSRDNIQRDLQLLLDDAHRKQRRLDAGNQTVAEAHAGQQADDDELIFPGSLSSTEDDYLPPLDIEGHGIEPVIQLCVLDAAKAQSTRVPDTTLLLALASGLPTACLQSATVHPQQQSLQVQQQSEQQQQLLILRHLLATGQLFALCTPKPEILQALFRGLVCSPQPEVYAVQLQAVYMQQAAARARGQTEGLWQPSLDDFLQALLQLGYRPPGADTLGNAAAPREVAPFPWNNLQLLLRLMITLLQLLPLATAPHNTEAFCKCSAADNPSGGATSQGAVGGETVGKSFKGGPGRCCLLCQGHSNSTSKALATSTIALESSHVGASSSAEIPNRRGAGMISHQNHQYPAALLVCALLQMQLDPGLHIGAYAAVCGDVQAAVGALIEAPHPDAQWDSVVASICHTVTYYTPSHRAALHMLDRLPVAVSVGMGQGMYRGRVLRRAMALALLRQLVASRGAWIMSAPYAGGACSDVHALSAYAQEADIPAQLLALKATLGGASTARALTSLLSTLQITRVQQPLLLGGSCSSNNVLPQQAAASSSTACRHVSGGASSSDDAFNWWALCSLVQAAHVLVLTAVLEAHSTAVKEDRNQGVTDEGSDTGTPNVRLAVAAALSFMVSWLGALDSAVPKGGVRHNITTMRLLHTAADAKLLYEQMKKA